MIQLDFRSDKPIYEQIVSQYKYLMLKGYLHEGDEIPSVRKLALQLEITPGTVAKAYREMESIGLIETLRGRGTFIASLPKKEDGNSVTEKEKNVFREALMDLVYHGMTKEEALRLTSEIIDSLKGGDESAGSE